MTLTSKLNLPAILAMLTLPGVVFAQNTWHETPLSLKAQARQNRQLAQEHRAEAEGLRKKLADSDPAARQARYSERSAELRRINEKANHILMQPDNGGAFEGDLSATAKETIQLWSDLLADSHWLSINKALHEKDRPQWQERYSHLLQLASQEEQSADVLTGQAQLQEDAIRGQQLQKDVKSIQTRPEFTPKIEP